MTTQDETDIRWQPSADLHLLRKRAQAMQGIRDFFHHRGYLEVETPIMCRFGITDVYLSNVLATFRNKPYCLQTSPEYPMKRLLAAGSGPIYQLARVFRDDELGRWHNPEFTLLEWYQPGIDHHALLTEVDALLQRILSCPPLIKKTYGQAFLETCGLNPFEAKIDDFKSTLTRFQLDNVLDQGEEDRDQYLFLLMSHVVEPQLGQLLAPVAVYDFPASQAALAQLNAQGFAERFEVYFRGVELANGFHELTDARAQQQRFEQDLASRLSKGLPLPAVDSYLLAALEHGLPPCSGVALGVDRLLALAFNQPSLAQVMAFDFSRA
ncbi:elongation factor P--(R)-beta-lysine ligase [Legionella sp. MW5194]|uniref:elongation factor P--(R)-beta-lysine ligase n=1 Tax=Legionella sp. MW5194 TaxID=2662448 RepID=UPI00193C9637|nr:elongation factor P--(R)-beta-lysine ligase [Legionella sp. MW5194]QRN03217.1 elongation factor P--(R)-beta-lysine ligase [Legionella sp. MW5194]